MDLKCNCDACRKDRGEEPLSKMSREEARKWINDRIATISEELNSMLSERPELQFLVLGYFIIPSDDGATNEPSIIAPAFSGNNAGKLLLFLEHVKESIVAQTNPLRTDYESASNLGNLARELGFKFGN